MAVVLAATVLALAGCSNPDAVSPGASGVQNQGEPVAPAPSAGEAAADVRFTPQAALAQYARLYVNWSWATLAEDQKRLAVIAVGQARLTDEQAAAQAQADATLRRSRVSNSGAVVSIAPDQAQSGTWVVVTRERTRGSGEYEALPAAMHVTLAKVRRVRGGWAVREWLPQS